MRKILLLLILFVLLGFKSKESKEKDYIFVCIKGTAINLYSKKPLKKTEIILVDEEIKPASYEKVKTNSKGEFIIYSAGLEKNKLQFWLGTSKFAQIKFINQKIIPGKWKDTINLDTVYFVPYFNEIKKVYYNFPEPKKEKTNKNCFTLKQVDSIFSKNETKYNMKINSIDTINEEIMRIGYYYKKSLFHKKESKRGTIVSSYKTLTLIRDLK